MNNRVIDPKRTEQMIARVLDESFRDINWNHKHITRAERVQIPTKEDMAIVRDWVRSRLYD
jgi:hypothetical protein